MNEQNPTSSRTGAIESSEAAARIRDRASSQRGQATVEYVGLAVAVAVLLVSVGGGLGSHGGKLGDAIAKRLTSAVGTQ